MRSGSDEVELDRSVVPARGGPQTGPPPLLPCLRGAVGLVQRTSRAGDPVPPAESDARGSGVGLKALCPRSRATMQKRPPAGR
ncbi:hypothetical protein D0Z67_18670 [Streptomyces seoulensis]|uniref:Uncharacterized protein n=1 Tax=Streptomyces seoulensis TaxID=73044 RepID=A0A4P6TZ25_STRSO|nr:hypothetical protein D0Z67_18670 [Streptomyces seoulensis]